MYLKALFFKRTSPLQLMQSQVFICQAMCLGNTIFFYHGDNALVYLIFAMATIPINGI